MTLLSAEAIDEVLDNSDWDRDGDALAKTVQLTDFKAALAFVNAVGELAEQANHHPDIDIRWNTVSLRLSTHSEGGITEKDAELAEQINALVTGE